MIRLKQLLFEQTGTTTIKVGNTDVVGTTVNNTESKNDPWTYFVSTDGTYYTTKKSAPNAWKNLQTSLSAANLQKAKSRIDKWKLATPATPATNATDNPVVTADGGENPVVDGGENPVVDGGENPVVDGGENPVVDGGDKTKTESKININQLDSLPLSADWDENSKLTGNILTYTDSEPRVIDLTGVDNLSIIPAGTYWTSIDATSYFSEPVGLILMVDKTKRLFRKPESIEPNDVYDPAVKNYINITTPPGAEPNATFCIIKTNDGKYKAFYVD